MDGNKLLETFHGCFHAGINRVKRWEQNVVSIFIHAAGSLAPIGADTPKGCLPHVCLCGSLNHAILMFVLFHSGSYSDVLGYDLPYLAHARVLRCQVSSATDTRTRFPRLFCMSAYL